MLLTHLVKGDGGQTLQPRESRREVKLSAVACPLFVLVILHIHCVQIIGAKAANSEYITKAITKVECSLASSVVYGVDVAVDHVPCRIIALG